MTTMTFTLPRSLLQTRDLTFREWSQGKRGERLVGRLGAWIEENAHADHRIDGRKLTFTDEVDAVFFALMWRDTISAEQLAEEEQMAAVRKAFGWTLRHLYAAVTYSSLIGMAHCYARGQSA